MTQKEYWRCKEQLARMSTPRLKEMAEMMETKNGIEAQALSLILSELRSRGVRTDGIKIGKVDATIP